MVPSFPVPTTWSMSTSFCLAKFRSMGGMRGFEISRGGAVPRAAFAIWISGSNSEVSGMASVGFHMYAITSPTETSSPSAALFLNNTPAANDSSTMTALSVSISAIFCPRMISAPSSTSHRTRVTVSTAAPMSGILTGIAGALLDNCSFLERHSTLGVYVVGLSVDFRHIKQL